MNKKIKVIVNPVAGNGRILKIWSELKKKIEEILGTTSTQFTKIEGEATRLTRNALQEGFEIIIAVGGDGTINEVVNGFFEKGKPITHEAGLGILSTGTGSDFSKTVGLKKDHVETLRSIQANRIRRCDVGRLTFKNFKSDQETRYFINVADVGFGGHSVKLINRSSKKLGPSLTYFLGLLRTLWTYKNASVQLQIDDGPVINRVINSVVLANGQYFGGGMWIAPDAKMDDGFFDIIIIGEISKLEILSNIKKLYNGTLSTHPKVQTTRGKKITITSSSEVLIDADGESVGMLPATFKIIPNVLNVIH